MTKMLSRNKKCIFFQIPAVCTGVCANMGARLLFCSQDHFMTYLVYTGILLDIFLHFDVGCCC